MSVCKGLSSCRLTAPALFQLVHFWRLPLRKCFPVGNCVAGPRPDDPRLHGIPTVYLLDFAGSEGFPFRLAALGKRCAGCRSLCPAGSAAWCTHWHTGGAPHHVALSSHNHMPVQVGLGGSVKIDNLQGHKRL